MPFKPSAGQKWEKNPKAPLGCKYLDYFQGLVIARGSLEACGAAVMWLFAGAGWLLVPGRKGLLPTLGGRGANGATEGMLSAPPPRQAWRRVVWDSGQW